MKNLTLPLMLTAATPLFAGVQSPVMAPPAPDCTAGWTVGLEALYLKAYQSEGAYDDADYEFGGRGSIGYDFNDCLFIKATYFGYGADVSHDEEGNVEEFSEDNGQMNASYLDLVVGQHFKPSESLSLSPYVGLRWGTFEESTEERDGGLRSVRIRDTESEFSGLGVVAGIDGVRSFGNGFSLYGTAKQSVVFGETDHSFNTKFEGAVPKSLELDQDDDDTDNVLFVTELGLGLQYDFCFSGVNANVRLGVEGQWWAGLSENDSENVGLAGFVLGSNFKF